MCTDETYQEYAAELAEKLDLRDHLRRMIDGARQTWDLPIGPREATEYLAALDEDICALSMWIFARDAQTELALTEAPTLSQRAAGEIARRLWTPPSERADLERWRVSFPCQHERPLRKALTNTEKRHIEICDAVCARIERGMTRNKAIEEVAPLYHLGKRTVERAYDDQRERVKAMRQQAELMRQFSLIAKNQG
ncbi:hypothetical protein [Paraburkholderia sp. J11-2]|uniref:hypothetical protein n=1 Tax=Paraburkholderia sp. J11-2 TaxID=2805431 RepID=UPI002AB6CE6B|nr:hypothetical protein [Paraburkholderia sp. J11-2]